MSLLTQVRPGAYHDSVVLMQLQRALAALPGVEDAGVVMGTDANRDLLAQSRLLDDDAQRTAAEDLIIAVRAATPEQAADASARQRSPEAVPTSARSASWAFQLGAAIS